MANPSKVKSLLADENDNPIISTQNAHIVDALVNYTDDAGATDLDTDAKRVAAMNATNAKINAILVVLENHGLVADA